MPKPLTIEETDRRIEWEQGVIVSEVLRKEGQKWLRKAKLLRQTAAQSSK